MLEPLKINYPSVQDYRWHAKLIGNTIWSNAKPPGNADDIVATAFKDLKNCKPGILERFISWIMRGIDRKSRVTQIAALDKFAEAMQSPAIIEKTSLEWGKRIIECRLAELEIATPIDSINTEDLNEIDLLRHQIGIYRGALINACCHMTGSTSKFIEFYDLCQIIGILPNPTIMVSVSETSACRYLIINLVEEGNAQDHGFLAISLMEQDKEWIDSFYKASWNAIDKITPTTEDIKTHVNNIDNFTESSKEIISEHDEMDAVVNKLMSFYYDITSPSLISASSNNILSNTDSDEVIIKDVVNNMMGIINGTTQEAKKRNIFLRKYNDYSLLQDDLRKSFYSYIHFSNKNNHRTLGGQGIAFALKYTDIKERYNCWNSSIDLLEQCHTTLQKIKAKPEGFAGNSDLVKEFCECMEKLFHARIAANQAAQNLAEVQNGRHLTCSMILPALTHANQYLEKAGRKIDKMDKIQAVTANLQYKLERLELLRKEAELALHEAPIAMGDNGINLQSITNIMKADELYQIKYNDWVHYRETFINLAEDPRSGLITNHRSSPTPAMHFDWDWKTYRAQILDIYEKVEALDNKIKEKYLVTKEKLEADVSE